ncbi:Signal transduction histidine kinase [Georgenia satyanarayanai]|uniref:histidine kinase n=1 Tax=Georgenia satyanarayanai TaxID=860221 RepID=A0A2Y8ZYN9_9MICO|nr:histidine kinase [Georgenia satyanarayanai]PYG02282.1 signal transduction histidine kinase [Georgenia satyanarayanai]SSA37135.1 Signal transduction histidine kinase [Georgenia satyanarayanai]
MDARPSPPGRRWEALLAVALVGLALVPGVARQGVDLAELPDRAMDPVGWALLVAQGASIALLRRWPAAGLAVVGTAFGAHQLLGYPTTFAALGLLVALVAAGALTQRRRVVTAGCALAGYVLLSAALAAADSPTGAWDFVVFGLMLASLWLVGSWLRGRVRAQEGRRREAERAAVERERSRIARELHDVVTHHVTAMVVQADAAQYSPDRDATRTVLTTISDTGRAALTDLRGLLGALDGADDGTTREPAVVDVEELVAKARAAGQPVDLVQLGESPPRGAATSLAVSRLVQESLTNAMKHARGAATQVRVQYEESGVEVSVTTERALEPGLGRGSGQGLIGLRERVALLGGVLDAGPVDGRFVVHARIPA